MRNPLSRYGGAGAIVLLALAGSLTQNIVAKVWAAEPGPTVIRHFTTHGNVAPFELAGAKGWLAEKNIKLESQGYSQGGPESLTALAAGSVDLAGAATPAIINAIAGGAKFLAVLPSNGISKDVNGKFFVRSDSKLTGGKDLKDASIAVNTLGAHLDYTVREYLKKDGLKKDDVRLITVPGPQLNQVLRHKQADVVAVGSWQGVFAGKILAEGGVRVLFTDHDVLGDIILSSDAMQKSFVEKHPQAITDFVTASARAIDWATENPTDARKLIAEILKKRGENPDLAQYWPGYGLRRNALYTDHDAQFWIDVLTQVGKLKSGQFTPGDIETNKYNALNSRAEK